MGQVLADRADPECAQCLGKGFRAHLVSLDDIGGSPKTMETLEGAEMVILMSPCECLKPWPKEVFGYDKV